MQGHHAWTRRVSRSDQNPELQEEVAELRAEIARLRAERQSQAGEDVAQTPRQFKRLGGCPF